MSDALERLRQFKRNNPEVTTVPVADLRELIALYDEAVRVMRREVLDVAADRTWCRLCRTEWFWNSETDRADRHTHAASCFLAKAGGK